LRELKINSFLFRFTEKPEILQDPNDLEIVFGETAVFKCRVEGDPTPVLSWMLNSKEIDASDSRIRVALDGTLEIDRIDARDQGVCKCGRLMENQ
jgi:peroxidase